MQKRKTYEDPVDEAGVANEKMQKYESAVKYISLDQTVDQAHDKTVNRTFGEADEPQNEKGDRQASNVDSVRRSEPEAQTP
jgi:hypothetical protein